jgi:hypothetical protein
MNCRNLIICLGLLGIASCANDGSIPAVPNPSPTKSLNAEQQCERKFHDQIDQQVTLIGPFSLSGKLGPFIVVDGCEIYLRSDEPFDWNDDKYARMERQEVRVIGTLRFKSNPKVLPPGPRPVARAPDHFYFDPRTSTIQLTPK